MLLKSAFYFGGGVLVVRALASQVGASEDRLQADAMLPVVGPKAPSAPTAQERLNAPTTHATPTGTAEMVNCRRGFNI